MIHEKSQTRILSYLPNMIICTYNIGSLTVLYTLHGFLISAWVLNRFLLAFFFLVQFLILLAMITSTGLGRLEDEFFLSIHAHDVDSDILRLHNVATLPHWGDRLRRVILESVPSGGNSKAFAVAPARICGNGEFHTFRNSHFPSVSYKEEKIETQQGLIFTYPLSNIFQGIANSRV